MNTRPRVTPATSRRLLSLLALASVTAPSAALAATFTWDGGGVDGNTGTVANWSTDVAPAATGDNLIFAGTTNLNVANNSITSLSTGTAGSFTFASGAGSFNIGGNAFTVGTGGGGGLVIVQQNSSNNQTISANLNLSGGNGDRSIVFGTGAGSLTLSGNITFNGDWLFPTTVSSSPAGTLILSGTNVGDGKTTAAITAGTNTMRAMLRNNVAGTNLVLGSDGALGNSGTGDAAAGTASLRGIIANQNLNLSTTNGDRNLSGSTLAINAANITFSSTGNLIIGGIVNQAGNRDFVVSNTGGVTVSTGIYLSGDQTGRRLFNNLSGAGGMVVNGRIFDTLHSGGITANVTTTDSGAVSTKSLLRKAGAGTLTLNGDSSSTFTGVVQVEAGTLKIGHSGALGSSTGANDSATQLMGGTLDLNGQNTAEFIRVLSNSTLANSSGTAANLTSDATLTADLAINSAGDITVTRLIGAAASRTITKTGSGTLTTNGTSHNNLTAWNIQAGAVVLANTSGFGADRGVTLSGGTLRLSGANSNLVNDDQSFTINSGVFDLNGKAEAVASVAGSGGTIRNGAAGAATLFVGGGVGGNSTATFAGSIQDGTGRLNVTKEGTGAQTFAGSLTHSGNTTISNGEIVFASGSSLRLTLANGGVSNRVTGTSSGIGTFNGTLRIDFSTVTDTAGTWSLIDLASLSSSSSFGGSFAIQDNAGALTFSKAGSVWTSSDNFWAFSETTGALTLSAIPEPSSFAGFAGVAILGFAASRRKRRKA